MYTLKKLLEWLKALPVDFTDKFFHIFKRWKRSNRFPAGTTPRVKEHMSDPVIIKKAPKAPKKPPYKPVLHLIGITELLSTELREIFEIITSTNALEGFSKTKHQLPDLVICEVNLPGYSGIELCRRLKETSKTQYIPIILLVPKTSDEEIITALRNGADDIVEKPVCSSILKVKAKNLVDYNKQLKLHVQKESTEMISPFPISDPVFLKKAQML